MAKIAKLGTIGLCSGALILGGASSAAAESDSENLLQKARDAGIGKVVPGKATLGKVLPDGAVPDVAAPFSAQTLVDDPDYLVLDVWDDRDDGTSVPSINVSLLGVPVSYPETAEAVAITDVDTTADMTDDGAVSLQLDLDGDDEIDLISGVTGVSMALDMGYATTFYEVVGSDPDDWIDTGIQVGWFRGDKYYVAVFEVQDLPKTKVSWGIGIIDKNDGIDVSPNVLGPPVELDKVAPNTKITSGTSGKVDSRSAKFYFKSTEAGSTFQCRFDNGSWRACVSPKVYKGLKNGEHKFRVRATDKAGNTDPTRAARSFITAKRIKVTLEARKNRSKLLVDVNPNKASKNYRIKVQKKKAGKWKTVLTTKTKGPGDRRLINMNRGRYRINVPAQFGMLRGTSNSVWLKR